MFKLGSKSIGFVAAIFASASAMAADDAPNRPRTSLENRIYHSSDFLREYKPEHRKIIIDRLKAIVGNKYPVIIMPPHLSNYDTDHLKKLIVDITGVKDFSETGIKSSPVIELSQSYYNKQPAAIRPGIGNPPCIIASKNYLTRKRLAEWAGVPPVLVTNIDNSTGNLYAFFHETEHCNATGNPYNSATRLEWELVADEVGMRESSSITKALGNDDQTFALVFDRIRQFIFADRSQQKYKHHDTAPILLDQDGLFNSPEKIYKQLDDFFSKLHRQIVDDSPKVLTHLAVFSTVLDKTIEALDRRHKKEKAFPAHIAQRIISHIPSMIKDIHVMPLDLFFKKYDPVVPEVTEKFRELLTVDFFHPFTSSYTAQLRVLAVTRAAQKRLKAPDVTPLEKLIYPVYLYGLKRFIPSLYDRAQQPDIVISQTAPNGPHPLSLPQIAVKHRKIWEKSGILKDLALKLLDYETRAQKYYEPAYQFPRSNLGEEQ